MGKRRNDGAGRGRGASARVRCDISVPRLDAAERQTTQARRNREPRLRLGSARARSTPHQFSRPLSDRLAHEQSPRALSVFRRGQRHRRPHAQGGPGRVVVGQPRSQSLDVQASARDQVAEGAATQRAGIRGR